MEATNKAPQIDQVLSQWFGKSRIASVSQGLCMFCDASGINEASFRDELSIKEYTISGLCQDCQDEVFG